MGCGSSAVSDSWGPPESVKGKPPIDPEDAANKLSRPRQAHPTQDTNSAVTSTKTSKVFFLMN